MGSRRNVGRVIRLRADCGTSALGKLGRRFKVRLLHRQIGAGGRWLVDAEGELHSFYGTRLGALLAVALLFGGALADHVAGEGALEIGGLELLDTPVVDKITLSGSKAVEVGGNRWTLTGLSPCRVCHPCILRAS